MTTVALIDSDVVGYRCAASCEPMSTKPEGEPVDFAIQRMDELMWKILATTEAEEFRCFLSGGDNFRYLIYPEYKANRVKPPPAWLDECRKYLIQHWKAEIVVGYEADDAIGMSHKDNTIIVSNDKDFKQLIGKHYNFVTDMFDEVDEDTADYNFWRQMLMGDRADNIIGVAGIGDKKSEKLLTPLTPRERSELVLDLYNDPARFTMNMKLLRILRSMEEYHDIIGEIHESVIEKSEGQKTPTTDSGQDSGDIPSTGKR